MRGLIRATYRLERLRAERVFPYQKVGPARCQAGPTRSSRWPIGLEMAVGEGKTALAPHSTGMDVSWFGRACPTRIGQKGTQLAAQVKSPTRLCTSSQHVGWP